MLGLSPTKDYESNPKLAARLGANARRTVEERFSPDLMIDRFVRPYRELLDGTV